MSGPLSVKINGADKIQAALENVKRKVANEAMRDALSEGGDAVLQEMRREVPTDSGFLEEHLGVRVSLKGARLSGSAFIGPEGKINYPPRGKNKRPISAVAVARFLEFGTEKMAANPFMTRAYEQSGDSALRKIIRALQRVLFQEHN